MLKKLRSGEIINTDKIELIKKDMDGDGYHTPCCGYLVELTEKDVEEIMQIVNLSNFRLETKGE